MKKGFIDIIIKDYYTTNQGIGNSPRRRGVQLEPRSGSMFLAVGFNPRGKRTNKTNIVKYTFSLALQRTGERKRY